MRNLWTICGSIFAGLMLWASLPTFVHGQDSLQTLRQAVRTTSNSGSSSGSSSSNSCDDDDDDCCDDDDGWDGGLIGMTLLSPYWLPHMAIDRGVYHPLEFPSFPYDAAPGYLQDFPREHDDWFRLRKSRDWAGQFSFEAGDSFNDQHYLGGRLRLESLIRVGIEADVRRWEESAGPWQGDSLWIGETDAVIRFAQNEHWMFRSGLGVNWLSDETETNFGFNFTYGIDWFPVQPLVFSAEVDLGSLGQAWLLHMRTSAGVTWHGTEIYAAYDYYDIGDAQLNGMSLGVRLWF